MSSSSASPVDPEPASPEAVVHAAARRLQAASVPTEALAEFQPVRRRFLVFTAAARFIPVTEVWRVGRLLLSTQGDLYAHGATTRSAKRLRLGLQSASQELRRDLAGVAFNSGFAEGAEVNYGAQPIPLDPEELVEHLRNTNAEQLPVAVVDGEIRVLWRPGMPAHEAQTLSAYVNERIALMIHPPGQDSDW
jgi:hypothetical protein